jgi:hypothetical protein
MTLVWRPGFQFDDDASTYIEAVEAADTQALETNTRYAINNFVIGCKADGIWSAIKASCILAGARTLTGALVPLVGTAPTNVGPFVSGDYNRKTGLVGNGSTKYLNSNRPHNADPLNSSHISVWAQTFTLGSAYIGIHTSPRTRIVNFAGQSFFNSRAADGGALVVNPTYGLIGASRSSASNTVRRINQTSNTSTVSSDSTGFTTNLDNIFVFGTSDNGVITTPTSSRFAFYSIGESLDLALLDARVTDLINAFAAAIP